MEFMYTYLTDLSTSREDYEMPQNYFPLLCFRKYFSMWLIYSPCETAGLEQLLVKGILELPGVNDESSQCLLFILLAVVDVLLPQFEVDDALLLLLSVGKKRQKKIKQSKMKSLKCASINRFRLWLCDVSESTKKNYCATCFWTHQK